MDINLKTLESLLRAIALRRGITIDCISNDRETNTIKIRLAPTLDRDEAEIIMNAVDEIKDRYNQKILCNLGHEKIQQDVRHAENVILLTDSRVWSVYASIIT